MSPGGAAAGMVAVIAARRREKIFMQFRQNGAISPATAMTLGELGLSGRSMFRMQVRKTAVVEVGDGRYYLDEETVERQQRRRQWLMLALLLIIVLMIVGTWLSG